MHTTVGVYRERGGASSNRKGIHFQCALYGRVLSLFGETDSPIEKLDPSLAPRAKVIIQSLRKRYADGKLAVKDLSIALVEGQITCLLGSNGAGKSTTIGVLTGLIEATSGKVEIYGNSLTTDMRSIRQLTGICPQQNVLIPTLTVRENLDLFGCIKGIENVPIGQETLSDGPTKRARDTAIRSIVEEVGLVEKLDVPASQLSGGQKRKLSLAIALIGNPKFVLLDEPTSGMDPYSRRSTWEMLLKYKKGRVVVLTTHFMEEADNLGDRIAIISEGRLRCSGSSLFLKSRFGSGYVLSMAKNKDAIAKPVEEGLPHSCYNSDTTTVTDYNLLEAVKDVVPTAKMTSSVAGEIIFSLPLDTTSSFARLFASLKEKSEVLGISSYGVSITTLEQVFIRLAAEAKTKASKRFFNG